MERGKVIKTVLLAGEKIMRKSNSYLRKGSELLAPIESEKYIEGVRPGSRWKILIPEKSKSIPDILPTKTETPAEIGPSVAADATSARVRCPLCRRKTVKLVVIMGNEYHYHCSYDPYDFVIRNEPRCK